MDPVVKALWIIESRFASDISLNAIADAAGVSPFHLCRAFGEVTGHSVMRYVRARRLTEAARQLGAGAPDILCVALDWGYGSHEAFTRAFRDLFGLTPEALRDRRSLAGLPLLESVMLTDERKPELEPARFCMGDALKIAGLGGRYCYERNIEIPSLWQRLRPWFGAIPNQRGLVAYGVCHAADETGFDYLAGAEVSSTAELPVGFTHLTLSPQRYAVFEHHGHVAAIRDTHRAIWRDWLPRSGYAPQPAPSFERHDERFDVRTLSGVIEIWIPLKPEAEGFTSLPPPASTAAPARPAGSAPPT